MKYPILCIIALIVSSSVMNGQDERIPERYCKVVEDRFTGFGKVVARNEVKLADVDGKMVFNTAIYRSDQEIYFNLIPAKKTCFPRGAHIVIEFVDGKSLPLKLRTTHDCNSTLSMSFGGIYKSHRALIMLANGTIKSMKFKDNRRSYNLVLKPNQGETIKKTLDCIMSGD